MSLKPSDMHEVYLAILEYTQGQWELDDVLLLAEIIIDLYEPEAKANLSVVSHRIAPKDKP